MFVATKLNSELSLSSDQKTANTRQYKVTIRTISYWYLVETHSIPGQNEVENLTDINVDAIQYNYSGLTNIRLQKQRS
jgi:hypothetical protein